MRRYHRKKRIAVVMALLLLTMFSGCVKAPEAPEEATEAQAATETELFSEGVDTPIEVLEYESFTGKDKECFLKEGDKVAVISPSSLPSRSQADAVIQGLSEWGYVPAGMGHFGSGDQRDLLRSGRLCIL